MTPLMMAARAGQAECVKALLFVSDDRQTDEKGLSAVFYAARGGSLDCLSQFSPFSSLDVEGDATRINGRTLLMAAAVFHGEDTRCLQLLLPMSNPSHQDEDGITALSYAAAHGRAAAVALLLPLTDRSLRAKGKWAGQTVFHLAAGSLDLETIRLALPFFDPQETDGAGRTALMSACSTHQNSAYGRADEDEKCLSTLRFLAPLSDVSARSGGKGSDLDWSAMALLSQHNRPKSISWLAAFCAPDGARLNNGETPLMLAVRRGNADAIAALLPLSDANAQDNQGQTALHGAVIQQQADAARALLACPALDPNLRDQKGTTALMRAVCSPGHDFMAMILSLGAGLRANVKNNDGRTALMLAAETGDAQKTNLLIPDSDCDLRDNEGRTALDIAIAEASEECLPGLMRATDLLAANPQDGRTPLHLATKSCVPDLFLKILAQCPPEATRSQDNWGLTPLMFALTQRYESDARALAPLSDISQRDHKGRTALDHLISSASFGLLDALLAAVPDDQLQATLLEFAAKCAPVSAARLEAIDLARDAGIGSTANPEDPDPLAPSNPRRI